MAPFFMLDAYRDYLEKERRYSAHTVRAYLDDVSAFVEFIGSKGITRHPKEVELADVRFWVVSLMESKMMSRTVSRKLSSVRSYFRYLQRSGLVESNPADQVEAPRGGKRLPEFLEEGHAQIMLDDIPYPEGFEGLRDKLIMELFYGTGIRLSELVHIKEQDVHHSAIKVLGKRNKQRVVPLHRKLLELILDYRSAKMNQFGSDSSDYLVVLDNGNKVYPKFVYRKVNYYIGEASTLSKRSPHVLRHSFATHMLNHGADLNGIKEILGHANLSATQVYTHNSFEKLKLVHQTAHPRGDKTIR